MEIAEFEDRLNYGVEISNVALSCLFQTVNITLTGWPCLESVGQV